MVAGRPYALRFVRACIATLACLFPLSVFPAYSFAQDVIRHEFVRRVVDGDTVVLGSGEKVRYVGVNAPEKGEPFYAAARRRNAGLVKGRAVKLVVCAEEPKDKYGRTLGWVYSGDESVNTVLLREGLARTLVIPPCGLKKRQEYAKAEGTARVMRVGIWSLDR